MTWRDPASGITSICVTNSEALLAFNVVEHADKSLELVQTWSFNNGGSSPVLANGVLYYAAVSHLYAIDPSNGSLLWQNTQIGPIHWQTPTVVNSSLYICDGAGQVWRYDVSGTPVRTRRRRPATSRTRN